ncbi:oxygenase MpaB family protein [Tessaracoccus sp. G1721]
MQSPFERLRLLLGRTLRSRVAGEDADEKAFHIWQVDGDRWHTPDDVIWHVNGDAAMYAGGIRSLLLQTLHPAAMAGVAGHSGYRSDPWGRLQRTSEFIATTTYGPIPSALALIERVRSVHERVRGKTDDGTPYRASDPHLLEWVHITETQSFLASFQHFGDRTLSRQEADAYVAQAAPVGELLGAVDLPRTEAELLAALERFRPELRVSAAARDTVDFLLRQPPVPWPARPGYWMLAAGAISTLPVWARRELGLPTGRWFDRFVGLPCGRLATAVVRWSLTPESRSGRWAESRLPTPG